jgi:hypothetical protein
MKYIFEMYKKYVTVLTILTVLIISNNNLKCMSLLSMKSVRHKIVYTFNDYT